MATKLRTLFNHVLIAIAIEHLYFAIIVRHSPLKDYLDIAVQILFFGLLFPWGVWTVLKLNLTVLKFEPSRGQIGPDGMLKADMD